MAISFYRREEAMSRKQPKPVHQLTVSQFEALFPDEDACKVYLQARRWPEGVRCQAALYGPPQLSQLRT